MTDRLRDRVDADDPALAELARLVRAASDLDPAPGAQDRVRGGLTGSRRRRSWFGRPVLVVLVLVAVTPVVVAGVRMFVAPPPRPAQVAPAKREGTSPASAHPATSRRAMPSSVPPERAAGEPVVTPEVRPPSDAALDRALDPALDSAFGPSPLRAAPVAGAGGPRLDPAARSSSATVSSVVDGALAAAPRRTVPPAGTATARGPGSALDSPRPDSSAPPTPSSLTPDSPPPGSPALPTPGSLTPGSPVPDLAPNPPHPPPATVLAPEAALVLRALHLLRFDHDAPGALRELDRYRARFPDGDLAEEALALAIEAHARMDDGGARALAEQYLQQFPRGRFRGLAERARAGVLDRRPR